MIYINIITFKLVKACFKLVKFNYLNITRNVDNNCLKKNQAKNIFFIVILNFNNKFVVFNPFHLFILIP